MPHHVDGAGDDGGDRYRNPQGDDDQVDAPGVRVKVRSANFRSCMGVVVTIPLPAAPPRTGAFGGREARLCGCGTVRPGANAAFIRSHS